MKLLQYLLSDYDLELLHLPFSLYSKVAVVYWKWKVRSKEHRAHIAGKADEENENYVKEKNYVIERFRKEELG